MLYTYIYILINEKRKDNDNNNNKKGRNDIENLKDVKSLSLFIYGGRKRKRKARIKKAFHAFAF